MTDKPFDYQEIDVRERIFALKSPSTGKFSVHDSYRDHYENGFLVALNAPEDVNKALRDLYYANEKGMIVSYRSFNEKIISLRSELISRNYPDKQLKDLSREERMKIEKDITRQVLKNLSINESTKLIYSPELSALKESFVRENKYFNFKYDKEKGKVFLDDQPEEKNSDEHLLSILALTEEINKITEKVINSGNLDDLELAIFEIENKYNQLNSSEKNNEQINELFRKKKKKIKEVAAVLKEKQAEYQNYLNEVTKAIFEGKDYRNLKNTIKEIEQNFSPSNVLFSDNKSRAMKDSMIAKLIATAKIITLDHLKNWEYQHLKSAKHLIEENLVPELVFLLKEKVISEENKIKKTEIKLFMVDLNNSKLIYEKLMSFSSEKELFKRFYSYLSQTGYEILHRLINDLPIHVNTLIILFAKKLEPVTFGDFWKNLPAYLIENLLNSRFEQGLKIPLIRNHYFRSLIEKGDEEKIISFFGNIEKKYLLGIEPRSLIEIIESLYKAKFEIKSFLKKLSFKDLFALVKTEEIMDQRLKENIIFILCRWSQFLDPKKSEFKELILNFPEFVVYNLNKKKIEEIEEIELLKFIELLEKKEDKQALKYFLSQAGEELFEKIIKLKLIQNVNTEPENFDNNFNLAISYLQSEDFVQAEKYLKKCLKINPKKAELLYHLGFLAEKMEKKDKALEFYKEAIRLNYDLPEPHYRVAMIHYERGSQPQAIQALKKLTKINPDFYQAHFGLGLIYDEIGDYPAAEEEYKKAIEIDPDNPGAYINLASVLSMRGDFQSAINYYNEALKYSPNNQVIHLNLGIIYQKEKNYPTAIAHYKLAIRYSPENSESYNNLGLVYFAKKDYKKAINSWKKAIELDNNIDSYNNLGWCYFLQKDLTLAIETYEKGKKINSKHSNLYLNLGTIYYQSGEINKAIVELQNYLDLENDKEKTFEVMKILMRLKKQNNS